jgi:hypothetical protein
LSPNTTKKQRFTVGRFDEIMAESDKIQAELFRRIIRETMSEKPKGVRKIGQDTGQQKHATCTDCGAKLAFYKKDVKTGSGVFDGRNGYLVLYRLPGMQVSRYSEGIMGYNTTVIVLNDGSCRNRK